MRDKTIEEMEAEVLIHQKTGAHRRIALLMERIEEKGPNIPDIPEIPEPQDNSVEEMIETAEETEDPIAVAYLLYKHGKGWKEIQEKTGVKSPWLRVKKYAKDNNLPYKANG